jgi:hypothetical protein
MTRSGVTFDIVRRIALALPGVEESTAYGSPALKFRGRLLACVPVHRSAEPGSLVVCVDANDRAELLAGAPDIYYVTDHYRPYELVLVRLARLDAETLRDLLGMAYKLVSRKTANRSPERSRRKSRSQTRTEI